MLSYKKGHLFLNELDLKAIAEKAKTPTYVYSLSEITSRVESYFEAFNNDVDVHYATKANSNVKVLKRIKKLGAGADVVSAGEAKEALDAGFEPQDIIFSGVAKTEKEITFALRKSIKQINVESPQELERIGELAKKLKKKARVAFRFNPDVSPETHPYITTGFRENKFGMDKDFLPTLEMLLKKYKKNVDLVGVTIHIGSQLLSLDAIEEAIRKTIPVYEHFQAMGCPMGRFDVGGGVGIAYKASQKQPDIKEYGAMVQRLLKPLECRILCEPGRYITGPAGVLLTEVQYIKSTPHKNFAIVDTGMHHLLRPVLYQAYHEILPLKQSKKALKSYDVVGPICESSDVMGKMRQLPELKQGDILVIADAGAYGYSMASHYNAHALPKEVVR